MKIFPDVLVFQITRFCHSLDNLNVLQMTQIGQFKNGLIRIHIYIYSHINARLFAKPLTGKFDQFQQPPLS